MIEPHSLRIRNIYFFYYSNRFVILGNDNKLFVVVIESDYSHFVTKIHFVSGIINTTKNSKRIKFIKLAKIHNKAFVISSAVQIHDKKELILTQIHLSHINKIVNV